MPKLVEGIAKAIKIAFGRSHTLALTKEVVV
jgi:hypothetical protein